MREREPTSTIEALEIEVDGESQRGQRLVLRVSDEEIRQEVRYERLRQVDPDVYRAHESDFMRAIAREILWRLVKQWKAQGNRTPVKVEATARTTRPGTSSSPRSGQAG